MQWAFVTANYVGRALGYQQYADVSNWGVNHKATVEQFHGPQFAERRQLVPGMPFRQLVQRMRANTLFEHVGQQHRIVDRRNPNTVPPEEMHVPLDVMPDLEHALILQQCLELLHDKLARKLRRLRREVARASATCRLR